MSLPTEPIGATQRSLLRALLRNKGGLAVEGLAEALGVSRNAVRQHLAVLERGGLVGRGPIRPSGGRPEQLYVLTDEGMERFPRQYSWFSELLLQSLGAELGASGLRAKLMAMGRAVAGTMAARLPGGAPLAARLAAIAELMAEIGYDTTPPRAGGEPVIEAHNCIFHQLAAQTPEVCSFDLALLSEASGCQVEHCSCMVRGDDACRFRFVAPGREPTGG